MCVFVGVSAHCDTQALVCVQRKRTGAYVRLGGQRGTTGVPVTVSDVGLDCDRSHRRLGTSLNESG